MKRTPRIALAGILLAMLASMKRAPRRIVLSGIGVALLALLFGATRSFSSTPGPPAVIALGPEDADSAAAKATAQVDTPPAAQAAGGWPFQQLPLVMKMEFPEAVPQIHVSYVLPPLVFAPIPVPLAPFTPPPPVAAGPPPPFWLLAPLAGVAVGGAEGREALPVVPEPATLLLLGTGLAGLGLGAKRRRRRSTTERES